MHAFGSNIWFGPVIHPFMVPQVDLYRQEVLLPLLWVLDDPKADVLVTERFALPYRLPRLGELARIAVLPHRPSSPVDLYQVAVVSVLRHSDISPVATIATITAGALVHAFIREAILVGGLVVVRVKEDVIVILRTTTTSIAIIVILQAIVSVGTFVVMCLSSLSRPSMLDRLFCFPKRVFAGFALQGVDKLGRSTAYIGLEQQDRGDVMSVILGKKDVLIPSPVLDKQEKQVVWSSHGLGFGRSV